MLRNQTIPGLILLNWVVYLACERSPEVLSGVPLQLLLSVVTIFFTCRIMLINRISD